MCLYLILILKKPSQFVFVLYTRIFCLRIYGCYLCCLVMKIQSFLEIFVIFNLINSFVNILVIGFGDIYVRTYFPWTICPLTFLPGFRHYFVTIVTTYLVWVRSLANSFCDRCNREWSAWWARAVRTELAKRSRASWSPTCMHPRSYICHSNIIRQYNTHYYTLNI